MADLTKTVSIIFQGEDRATAAVNNIDRSLGGLGDQAGAAGTKVKGLGDGLDGLGGNTGGIQAATTALQALAASLVFRAFIDANVELEKFDRAMTLITGSSAQAGKEFDYVRDVANRLGLQLFSTAENYVGLAAATKGTTLEGEGSRLIFEAVSRAMASLGRSSDDTKGALLAITQIVSKGTVSMEELRGQLGERLPGAFQIAARSMGLTTQELDALVSSGRLAAEDFLPKFALALNETFGNGDIEGYQASMNRLKTAVDEAFISIGSAGAFDVFVGGIQIGTAAVVGAVASFTLLGEIIGAVFAKLANPKSFDFGEELTASFDKAANATRQAGDAVRGLFGGLEDVKQTGTTAGASVRVGFSDAKFEAERLKNGTKEVDAALKTLGLDPKKFRGDIDNILGAFDVLTSNPAVRGDTILAGLKKTLTSLANENQVNKIIEGLSEAFSAGRLGPVQYVSAIELARKRILELGDAFPGTTQAAKAQADQLKDNAKAAEKARESAEKFKIEMEKLASNERIKNIEAKVTLDIAQLEQATQRIKATFASIDNTVNSTGELLGNLFALFKNYDALSFGAIRAIEDQIRQENRRRDDALRLQTKLTEAQIAQIRAQTQSIERGDALIKIDGAGLQPHLEAFMFEILRTLQVRVNQDGLKLLLGV